MLKYFKHLLSNTGWYHPFTIVQDIIVNTMGVKAIKSKLAELNSEYFNDFTPLSRTYFYAFQGCTIGQRILQIKMYFYKQTISYDFTKFNLRINLDRN